MEEGFRAETSDSTRVTTRPGPDACRLLANPSTSVAVASSCSLVEHPTVSQYHGAGSSPLTSPELDAAKDSAPLASRQINGAQLSTPSTSPETDTAQFTDRKAVAPGASGKKVDNDNGMELAYDTSCVAPIPFPRPRPGITCHPVRNRTRIPNPPLDLATALNRDKPLGRRVTATPIVTVSDWDGAHVCGTLAETAAIGGEPILFAKQVEIGQPSIPYGDFAVLRHDFFKFPQPDMGKINREFDEDYLKVKNPPTLGLDLPIVDKCMDRYAEETMVFAETMEEHQDQFDSWQHVITSNEKALKDLDEKRGRVIRDYKQLKSVLPARIPREYLAEIAAAEKVAQRDIAQAQREIRHNIVRGNTMIANHLRWDFDLPAAIDEAQVKKVENETAQEEHASLMRAARTIGTPYFATGQDNSAVQGVTQQLALVDVKGKGVLKDSQPSRFEGLNSAEDEIISTVPEWFTILDFKGIIRLRARNPKDRLKELLKMIADTSLASTTEQVNPPKKASTKEYHDPNPGWPYIKWRVRGGWWTCRSGPEASRAERKCKLCHKEEAEAPVPSAAGPSNTDKHKMLMAEVDKAMAEANKRDNMRLRERQQSEDEEKAQRRQQEEWRRQGGGFLAYDLLYGGRMDDVNYASRVGLSRQHSEPKYNTEVVATFSSSASSCMSQAKSQESFAESDGKPKKKGKSVSFLV